MALPYYDGAWVQLPSQYNEFTGQLTPGGWVNTAASDYMTPIPNDVYQANIQALNPTMKYMAENGVALAPTQEMLQKGSLATLNDMIQSMGAGRAAQVSGALGNQGFWDKFSDIGQTGDRIGSFTAAGQDAANGGNFGPEGLLKANYIHFGNMVDDVTHGKLPGLTGNSSDVWGAPSDETNAEIRSRGVDPEPNMQMHQTARLAALAAVGNYLGGAGAAEGAGSAASGGTAAGAAEGSAATGAYGGFDAAAVGGADYGLGTGAASGIGGATAGPGAVDLTAGNAAIGSGAPATYTPSGLISTESAILGQPASGATWEQVAAGGAAPAAGGVFESGAAGTGAVGAGDAALGASAVGAGGAAASAGGGGSSGGGSSGGSASGGGGLGGGSIFGNSLGSGDEWWQYLLRGVPGLLGAVAAGSQAEDFEDLAHEYKQMGEPYRTRLQQLYNDPTTFLNSPEVRQPIQQGTDMLAHSLSVKGNPAGSGNALQELQNYATTQLFGRLGQEKDRLAGFGGLTQYNSAAPQAASNSVAAQGNIYNALGGAAGDIFNPPKRYNLQDLLRMY